MNTIIYYRNALRRILAFAQKRRGLLSAELKNLPAGEIQLRKRKGSFSCYLSKNGKRHSIPLKDKKAAKLGRKMFVQKEMLFFSLLSFAINKFLTQTANFENGCGGRGAVTLSLLSKAFGETKTKRSPEELKWLASIETADDLRPQEKKYETQSGIKVRSKSERVIANMLFHFGLLFVYEPILIIGGETFCPDFIIRLPDGRVFIWERFGLMHDASYRNHALHKIEEYRRVGYCQHTNLICTYEEDMIDEKVIERIVIDRLCRI